LRGCGGGGGWVGGHCGGGARMGGSVEVGLGWNVFILPPGWWVERVRGRLPANTNMIPPECVYKAHWRPRELCIHIYTLSAARGRNEPPEQGGGKKRVQFECRGYQVVVAGERGGSSPGVEGGNQVWGGEGGG
jgi:hypothetical protein